MRERGELPMEHQNLNQEQKLRVALCGPLPKTERALLRRGDVEIIRDDDITSEKQSRKKMQKVVK